MYMGSIPIRARPIKSWTHTNYDSIKKLIFKMVVFHGS